MPPGERAIRFLEMLKHSKGEWAGHRLTLEPWQRQYVQRLFGTLNPDGTRQYRTSLFYVPRKNGKSFVSAGVALYCLLADGEPGAEVYGAAADRAQASLVFNEACKMIRQNRTLNRLCRIVKSSKVIEVPKTGSVYKALSADSYNKAGLNASAIIFDELYAQPNRELWDVLTTSTASRRQPLTVAITTAPFDQHSICYEQYKHGKDILEGRLADPTFLPLIYEAGAEDDPFAEPTWRRANPNYGVSVKPDYLRSESAKAQNSPAYLAAFKRFHLNIITADEDAKWFPSAKWAACAGDIDPAILKGKPCWCGLDLASVSDVAAFVMVFKLDDGRVAVLCRFWAPSDGAYGREKKDRVPYVTWSKDPATGLSLTPGNVVDYDRIRADINALRNDYNIQEIAIDRWNAAATIGQLQGDGFNVVTFGQGFASMAAPSKSLETLVLGGKLVHFNNPILNWMAGNVVAEIDAAGNIKPSKARSSEKIDGIVATLMGIGRMDAAPPPSPMLGNGGLLMM